MKCNGDCLNCEYEDCIASATDILKFDKQEKKPLIDWKNPEERKGYFHRQYLLTKEHKQEFYREYYKKHREELIEKAKKWNREHRQE